MGCMRGGATLWWAIDTASWYDQDFVRHERKLLNRLNNHYLPKYEDALKKIEFAEKLIIAGDKVNFKPKNSTTMPLHNALLHKRYEVVALLIKHGADIGASSQGTPLQTMIHQMIPHYFPDESTEEIRKKRYSLLTPEQKITMICDFYNPKTAKLVNDQLPQREKLWPWELHNIPVQSQDRIALIQGKTQQSNDCTIL